MALSVEDLRLLRSGNAPTHPDLVRDMTLGSEVWLDRFTSHYLDTYIPVGGSKFKLLVGEEGSGKSHLLRAIEERAISRGYVALWLSARTVAARLSDVSSLYRLIAANLCQEILISGMARNIGSTLGYGPNLYDGSKKLLPYVVEEGFEAPDAMREIRVMTARLLRQTDLGSSFFTCANTLLRDRLLQEDPQSVRIAWKWLCGEKLDPRERRESGLYETLNRTTARRWLDGLLKLIVLSGHQGILLLIDDLDVLHERNPETGRFYYTPAANKDTYELFRQLIDDADLLRNFLMVVAGRRSLIEDDRRGFKSYEALWMRLQTGLVPSGRFNPLCDIVDMDQHLEALGPDFPETLSRHLAGVFERHGIRRRAGTAGNAFQKQLSLADSFPADTSLSAPVAATPRPSLKTAVLGTLYASGNMEDAEVET